MAIPCAQSQVVVSNNNNNNNSNNSNKFGEDLEKEESENGRTYIQEFSITAVYLFGEK